MAKKSELARNMAACDANYIRLLKLVPQLRSYKNGKFCISYIKANDVLAIDDCQPEKILEGSGTRF